MPADKQLEKATYARDDLDRGYLARHQHPVRGVAATARPANTDTVAYTNTAPQSGAFNLSKSPALPAAWTVPDVPKAHHGYRRPHRTRPGRSVRPRRSGANCEHSGRRRPSRRLGQAPRRNRNPLQIRNSQFGCRRVRAIAVVTDSFYAS
ncbi:hypothetical protein E3O68_02395 [Cryobacterium sp. TMB3-1-2]|nr:hypothetical protein E3O68_02395 [Cryobacterium sp. TMB3-1-2]TFC63282.1 hypothetical protein E3O60_00280 [Cryobacterium sp. TMB1-7]TFC75390.1 hypothetical protein E3T21_00125 [Cryobacterium sp. TMB3-15]TFC77888.1 hypothetical protein E3T22_04650 [Cryobacterium sp. TMB3-10]TFD46429.1 hypothetical protein E3T58_00890 [Cryobacterium sp. TMB3-12]